jgi:hypothetical protein
MLPPPGRVLGALLAVVLSVSWGPLPAVEADAPQDLATGIRQVDEGDFEGAVLTLDAVVRTLGEQPEHRHDLARAHLYLAIAQLALGQAAPARTHFKEALRREPTLRLGADRNSPKVIAAFEAAREELRGEQRGEKGKTPKRGPSPAVYAVVGGAAAAVGVVLVTRGGDEGTGRATFSDARFSTPVIECPNGFRNQPIPLSLMVEASNQTKGPVTLNNVATVLIIATSAFPAEVGFASNRLTTAVPPTIPAGQSASVQLDTTLLCDNDDANPFRFNEWSGTITLTTSAGVFTLNAANRLRVNIP